MTAFGRTPALIASAGAGVFAALADPEAFNRAFVRLGAVCRPGGLDILPTLER